MDATAFCSNHVWKRWFWPQKLSMNATRFESAFWNAVYSKSAFWNAVYSKISMDATAFCSNHVWKRWFWPQKLSINAPLVYCTMLQNTVQYKCWHTVHGRTDSIAGIEARWPITVRDFFRWRISTLLHSLVVIIVGDPRHLLGAMCLDIISAVSGPIFLKSTLSPLVK